MEKKFCPFCAGRGKRHISGGGDTYHEDCLYCDGKGYILN